MGEGKLAMKYLYNGYRKEKYLLGGLEKDGSMASKNCSKKAGETGWGWRGKTY